VRYENQSEKRRPRILSGVSARNTKTSDTYSLNGFNDALAKIHAVCQL